jgi:hypothetical protein
VLLAAAWQRLVVAGVAVAALWAAVLWGAPSTPSTQVAKPAVRVAAPAVAATEPCDQGGLRAIVRSGLPAPGGGVFDRFDVPAQPVVAPVNVHGDVAFFATVLHAPGREGLFLSDGHHITRMAGFGDPVPGGGTLADFDAHPVPALNATGHIAFAGQIAGGRTTDGMFLATEDGLHVIALAGDDAPGVPRGVLVGFDAPALNDNDELAFVASVRRDRELLDVLYFWNGNRLQRLISGGDLLLRTGGTMERIGVPALNNGGVVAFPASIFKGPSLGGIFVAGARDLRLVVSAGEKLPDGGMIVRFSDHVAIGDDDAIVFGAYLGSATGTREAVLRRGPDRLTEVAAEGQPAPDGGQYAGFGPWPTVAPDGGIAFVAALDGGPVPLGAFAGAAGGIRRVAGAGEALPQTGKIGRFAQNVIAAAGPGGSLTFTTVAEQEGERSAVYCRCMGQ